MSKVDLKIGSSISLLINEVCNLFKIFNDYQLQLIKENTYRKILFLSYAKLEGNGESAHFHCPG